MGFFGTDIDIDITEAEKHYTWVNKAQRIVICNHCEGSGREVEVRFGYGGMNGTRQCQYCDGLGSLKVKIKAKK